MITTFIWSSSLWCAYQWSSEFHSWKFGIGTEVGVESLVIPKPELKLPQVRNRNSWHKNSRIGILLGIPYFNWTVTHKPINAVWLLFCGQVYSRAKIILVYLCFFCKRFVVVWFIPGNLAVWQLISLPFPLLFHHLRLDPGDEFSHLSMRDRTCICYSASLCHYIFVLSSNLIIFLAVYFHSISGIFTLFCYSAIAHFWT